MHALYEFLLNSGVSGGSSYHLSLQLLAPQPFAHASPTTPRLIYTQGVRAVDSAAGPSKAAGSSNAGPSGILPGYFRDTSGSSNAGPSGAAGNADGPPLSESVRLEQVMSN